MRVKLYLQSVGAAYVLLAVNIAYSLATIPLALHYLGKSVFGLWALTIQVGIVLQLADAGMSGALTRILIDYKDDKTSPGYRQTLYTVWLALVGISVTLLGLTLIFNRQIVYLLAVPSEYLSFYPSFVTSYLLLYCVGFSVKPIILVLIAHQRQYLTSISTILSLIAGFAILWVCLWKGMGLWSLLVAQGAGMMITFGMNFLQAKRLGYFPAFRVADCLQMDKLREVAHYGWQRVVATFGHTVLLTAPTFLITRFIGLEATAAWTVGTRTMQLAANVTCKLSDLSQPILAEMFVRNEADGLRKRFCEVILITLAVAAVFAGLITSSNHDFIGLWTGGKINWDPSLDIYIAVYFLLTVMQRVFWIPVSISKNLGVARYMTLVEGAIFLLILVLWPRESMSLKVVALALLAAGLSSSLPAYILRSVGLLKMTRSHVLKQLAGIILQAALPLIAIGTLSSHLFPSAGWVPLVGKSTLMVLAGALILLTMGNLRKPMIEFLRHIQKRR